MRRHPNTKVHQIVRESLNKRIELYKDLLKKKTLKQAIQIAVSRKEQSLLGVVLKSYFPIKYKLYLKYLMLNK